MLSAVFHFTSANIDALEDDSGCSHVAAYKFFTDSIENKTCGYTSYPCSSKNDFDKGICINCSARGCNRMGYWASAAKDIGSLYLNTQDGSQFPFCKHNFQVRLYSNDNEQSNLKIKQARGKFVIYLINHEQVLDESSIVFKPNYVHTFLLSVSNNLNKNVREFYLSYEKSNNLLR